MTNVSDSKIRLEDLSHFGKLRSAPQAAVTLKIQEDGTVLADGSGSQPFEGDGAPVTEYYWSARKENPGILTIAHPSSLDGRTLAGEVQADQIVLSTPVQDGEYYITLRVVDQQGREDRSTVYFVVENGQPFLKETDWENTEWVDRAVVYGVIPRNFGKPGFQGIIDHLDELQDLGITAMWLSPVNETPLGNYGYHVLDYFELADIYGSKEDFRRMVQEAHKRGIRVLMDFVPNHTSEHHRYFEDTLRRGKESPYWDFYDRDPTGAHTNYFHWSYLPNLNFNNPKVVQWITEAFAYWVREFDVDGFRVDVAWGIRQRNPEYWPYWRKALKRIKPDLLLLAEAGARDSYYFSEGWDAAYDWTDDLGKWAWEHVFEDRSLLTERLTSALTNQGKGFHPDALIFRFLNNNDTGARFITRNGVAMTRVATTLLLTLPGVPCIYVGDETGTEFLPYKTREPLDWQPDPHNLRPLHKKLIALRREMPALYSRSWQILETDPQQKIYAYLRWAEAGDKPVLVILNFFDADVEASVTIPEEFAGFWQNRPLEDLLSGAKIPAQDSLSIKLTIHSMGAVLLSPQ